MNSTIRIIILYFLMVGMIICTTILIHTRFDNNNNNNNNNTILTTLLLSKNKIGIKTTTTSQKITSTTTTSQPIDIIRSENNNETTTTTNNNNNRTGLVTTYQEEKELKKKIINYEQPPSYDEMYRNYEQINEANDGPLLWNNVCTQKYVITLPFCNISLSLKERVIDYSQRIPLGQKIKMMGNNAASYKALYIPPYQWWSEGLHGPNQICLLQPSNGTNSSVLWKCPTSFPCPAGLGTTYNNTLYNKIGSTIGREGRAFSNLKNHNNHLNDGIDYWSPVVNLQRDPRWGRNQEIPSEDPYVTSQYAIHYINGLQQQYTNNQNNNNQQQNQQSALNNENITTTNTTTNPNPIIQIGGCCKHYIGNSLERWHTTNRHEFDAIISNYDLENYYLLPFRACIQDANVIGIMCSYNAINGIPSCSNVPLLKDILRTRYNFTGYITSDCGAIDDIYQYHNYTTTPEEAVASAIHATTDVDCGSMYQTYIPSAIKQNLINETTINESFERLVLVQMKLGLFDNNKQQTPYASYGYNDIDTIEHQQLAYEAAQQSIVLLQNRNSTLPFLIEQQQQGGIIKIAVIGPHYNATGALLSSYHGDRCSMGRPNISDFDDDSKKFDCIETPVRAIEKYNTAGETIGIMGCHLSDTTWHDEIETAIQIANTSDIIILMMGIDRSIEAEERDRIHTTLPGLQNQLIESILDLQKPNTVLVLLNGGALSLGESIINKAPAIVDIFYGGQSASQAMVDVLFGKFNPVGKLSATMYPPSYVDDIPLTEMSISVGVGRTYMYYTGTPEFSFGYGLSYSDWSLLWIPMSSDNTEDNKQIGTIVLPMAQVPTTSSSRTTSFVQINVQNLGPYSGSQTVLLFYIPTTATTGTIKTNQVNNNTSIPKQVLVGYTGTSKVLEAGQSEILSIEISHDTLARTVVATGEKSIISLMALAANNVQVTKSFRIVTDSKTVEEA